MSAPIGIDCGTVCTAAFPSGTVVTLSAMAWPGSTFAGWSGEGCSGTDTCQVTMDQPRTVTATFALDTFTLSVGKAGNGAGTVTSSPAGIGCGTVCSSEYDYGTLVTLSAIAGSGSFFVGWSGGACSGTGDCQVAVYGAGSVTATFEVTEPELVVNNVGPGTGSVTSDPAGISCPGTCSATFPLGTTVTLTAAPDPGYELASWSGHCSGTGTCTVVTDGYRSAVAAFKGIGDRYTIRHHFVTFGDEGQSPMYGRPAFDGTYVYGTAPYGGGAYDLGVLYRMRLDGTGYTTLHRFSGGPDGGRPFAMPTLDGDVLYGITNSSSADPGTVFRINRDGSGYAILHSFAEDANPARQAYGPLTIAGGVLYGMTKWGGGLGSGIIFRLNADGTGFAVLHTFAGGADDGSNPGGSLTVDGGVLYGMTELGGAYNFGTIFKIDVDDRDFTVLHSFAADLDDGGTPYGSLTLDGGVLYGTTKGGAIGGGTVFKVNPDGSEFTLLHSFAGGNSDGSWPKGNLTLEGGVLYGTTELGGPANRGTVFKVNSDGSGFNVLHSFAGTTDGRSPLGSLLVSSGALYGMTPNGGKDDAGTYFTLGTDGSRFGVLHVFEATSGYGANTTGKLAFDGDALFGTSGGSTARGGTVFRTSPNGSEFVVLHSFAGGTSDGAGPSGGPVVGDGGLYGTTVWGGPGDAGTIFRINPDGSGYAVLHSFTSSEGQQPHGPLAYSDGVLYGMTGGAGSGSCGTIFRINIDGTGFAVLRPFGGGTTDGAQPYGSLTLNGNVLYGMTYGGGAAGKGTIFRIDTDGSDFVLLHSFSGGASDGAYPQGSLLLEAGTLYGMTYGGGANGLGTVFRIGTDGSAFALLHSFAGSDGRWPEGSLLLHDGTLYGMTSWGGAGGKGAIFNMALDGSEFAILHSFVDSPTDGSMPSWNFALTNVGSVLYGTTSGGGISYAGVIFSLDPSIVISGTVTLDGSGLAGVTLAGLPGDPVTDALGHYTSNVPRLWAGTVTPTLAGYAFTPTTRFYTNVQSDQSGQDHSAVLTYALDVVKTGTGSGTVTSSPVGIDCGTACTADFVAGTPVTLTAAASIGSTFAGWSGEGCSGTGTCQVTMTQARTVTAIFTLDTYALTVTKAGTGTGTVTSSPAGIDCGTTCTYDFPYPTPVALAAVASAGSAFAGWSGEGCSGTGTCRVTMDRPRSVTAIFELIRPQLLVSIVGPGMGTVTSSPPGIACSGTCSSMFAAGTTVTLTATPDPGFELASWSGDCSGAGTCTVVLDGSRSAVAAYKAIGDPYTIRHHYSGRVEGVVPGYGQPAFDGWYLYGTTANGGDFNQGVVYRMRLDGSDYTTLHSFSGGSDGASPNAPPTLEGEVLYGMVTNESSFPTIYRVNRDGTGYAVLHAFASDPNPGQRGRGSLTVAGGALYGMTEAGGVGNLGTIFKVNTDGTGFSVIHSFAGGVADGSNPLSSLTLGGGSLYGMTTRGGTSNAGTVFKIGFDGSGFALLHSFTGGAGDGAVPYGFLSNDGGVLYGMTADGGSTGNGTVFRINVDGSGFIVLHAFAGTSSDGAEPAGSLTVEGDVLYGMTFRGGAGGSGTIFRVNSDGSGYALLHSFVDGAGDGWYALGTLLARGGVLYGTTPWGGTAGGGVLFRIGLDGSGFGVLRSFSTRAVNGIRPLGFLNFDGSRLVGVTRLGGEFNAGSVFRVNPDGSGFSILHSFGEHVADGVHPNGSLAPYGGVLFGTTQSGGANTPGGTIFKVNPDGSGFAVLHSFVTPPGPSGDGSSPAGALVVDGGVLYGMTNKGGTNSLGTIFGSNPDGSGFTILHSFAGGAGDGAEPNGALTVADGVLYGVTYAGGASNLGTLFRIATNGLGFSVLHTFVGGISDGAKPIGTLFAADGVLYGTACEGGASNGGIVFKVNADGSAFTILHSFSGSDGYSPYGSLTLVGSSLYGMTYLHFGSVGPFGGVIFRVDLDGSNFTTLHFFAGPPTDGCDPGDPALAVVEGSLYGTTYQGGIADVGVLFSLDNSFEISGTVTLGGWPLAGVAMTGLPGNPVTDSSGHYTATVPLLWPGTVTPTLAGYAFTPASRTYTDVQADQTSQDYTAVVVHPLTVVKIGAGAGTVTSTPAGINCGATCTASFPGGTLVTLSASPAAGSTFTGWSGEGCSGTGTCEVTMTQARTVAASFSACVVTLSDQTVTTTMTVTSCDALSLGPALVVAAPGNLTARAGTRVTLRNGFSVSSGGVFKAGIDPGLLQP